MADTVNINFRGTLGYRGDDAATTYVQVTAAANNYPAASGFGPNVGWEDVVGGVVGIDRSATGDPRTGGINYGGGTERPIFRIDLPSAGTYPIRLALGDTIYTAPANGQLLDTNTVLDTWAGTTASAGNYFDAAKAEYTRANWTTSNSAVNFTFSTTILRWKGGNGTNGCVIAHLGVGPIVASGPNITSVSTATPREGATLTITGTNFGASQGSGDVKINGVAQTVTSWSDTSIAVTIVLGTNKFGAAYTVVVRDNALTASNSYAGITGLLPANSGLSYIDLGTPNATAAYRITAIADLASGDQLEYDNVGGLVAVASDATFSAGPGVLSFSCRAWTTGSGYGASASQNTSTAGSGTGVSKLRYAGVSFPSRLQASVSYYDP